jgi:hypothetical protein
MGTDKKIAGMSVQVKANKEKRREGELHNVPSSAGLHSVCGGITKTA